MRAPTASRVSDLLRVSLVAGVPLMLVLGRPASAWGMALIAATAVALRAAPAPPAAHLAFMAPLALDVWLTATGAMAHLDRQDTVGHLVLSAAVTPLVFHLAVRARVLAPPRPGRPGAVAVVLGATALTMALGLGWELVEAGSDAALGTTMSLGSTDTVLDLAADTAGGLLAAGALAWTLARGRRRGPVAAVHGVRADERLAA